MLSDSKIRQAGFIRNSSSRKIIYQPEPQKPQKRNSLSDDSFSSFQYETSEKGWGKEGNKRIGKNETSIVKKEQRERQQKSYESVNKQLAKQAPPQIPKPSKKPSPQQPTFQNQRLKNNFFNQPPHPPTNKPPHPLPRTTTPYFMQKSIKKDLQQVNNVCSRIGNMKLLEGNFSFNPKVNNKLEKGRLGLESGQEEMDGEGMARNVGNNSSLGKVANSKVQEAMVRKPKQNNYFSNTNNNSGNRFQYDFKSSSEEDQAEKSAQSGQQQSSDNQNQQIENERDDHQVLRYYQQQQRQRTEPEVMTRTKPKVTSPQNHTYGRISNHYQNDNQPRHNPHHKPSQHSHNLQNQQSSSSNHQQQQLIAQYNKEDFGTKMPTYMRRNNQQLTQNRKYQNTLQPQQGVIATNGGVCFSVDVKQFSQNASSLVGDNNSRPVKRYNNANPKKKKTNDREEILKRREMAKVYSKQARFRLFGFA